VPGCRRGRLRVGCGPSRFTRPVAPMLQKRSFAAEAITPKPNTPFYFSAVAGRPKGRGLLLSMRGRRGAEGHRIDVAEWLHGSARSRRGGTRRNVGVEHCARPRRGFRAALRASRPPCAAGSTRGDESLFRTGCLTIGRVLVREEPPGTEDRDPQLRYPGNVGLGGSPIVGGQYP
jgi:hypothetical protein